MRSNTPWLIRFYELKAFIDIHNRPPREEENIHLYRWACMQRHRYNKGKLSATKILITGPLKILEKKSNMESNSPWFIRFHELKVFFAIHNRPPCEKENIVLYRWTCAQRYLYNKGKLSATKSSFLAPRKILEKRAKKPEINLAGAVNRLKQGFSGNRLQAINCKKSADFVLLRRLYRSGKLPSELVSELKVAKVPLIATWVLYGENETRPWNIIFDECALWARQNGFLPTYRRTKNLYCWLNEQKMKMSKGNLGLVESKKISSLLIRFSRK
ncbi:helicase associated domain-containing protein [Puia dinghuensis]|uniref:helicase associated domain-containing protein n=1 Tax=Puia dinghuensis TaxID=1792502 RepID=UPI0016655540|nr:helicase associated domain-containing protein [Puia dinghuensis]